MRRRTRSAFFGVKAELGESDPAAHEPNKDPAAAMRRQSRSAFFEVKTELEESDAATHDPKKALAVPPGTAGASSSGRVGTRRATGRAAKSGAVSSKAASTSPKAKGNIGKASTSTPTRVGRREVKTEPKREESNGPTPARGTTPPAKRRRVRVKKELKVEGHEGSGSGASVAPDLKPVGKRIGAGDKNAGKQRQQQQQNQGKKKKRGEEGASKIPEHGSGRKIPQRLAEKATLIIQVMDALYPEPPIPINHVDSFTLLCGVLLSAQTTDGQVNEVTKELFRVAPDPSSLSKMSQEDLQRIIRSVGLAPTKAKHLIALSQQLLDRFDGQVPGTFSGLQSLPGVGRKTAAVVMVQAFGTPAFPVDTHIHRLALRWGLTKNEKNASKVEEDLMAVFPRESWAKLHLQFIYFGREHCQARVHESSACPVCSWIKKTGPGAPKGLSDLSCLRDFLACPTPTKKSSKNAIVYSERMLEMEQFRMKMEI